ncbi:sigma-54 interaction domain-containing protein [Tengunoibacter tsumagoiensis]|uniref:Sigma-54 factor interaction domain-containing protein n=1 Tax=Tengunoibacter tsumagoiensis TaxID=2014871 RepID=A0A401ZXS4_9CHLR|nr:sigma-54 dependent transcriptional regulator [Tengunoibacter tsumagoiensis]GCE11654.1 hypothetical protein KTT_15130 [Tengunoibacter tsumagoiensis]
MWTKPLSTLHLYEDEAARRAFLQQVMIGKSPAIQKVIELVCQVAISPWTPVLLFGESGTGKEVVAHAIHEASLTALHEFVPINCAAIPESLLETELFGVEAGAFTDAHVSREGYLMRANGGTFFLDEVSSMPLPLQPKLLRFLEEMTFRPVGGVDEHTVHLRVISATNEDLAVAVKQNAFRQDLLYRLNVFSIYLPALRERTEDIPLLIDHFLHLAQTDGAPTIQISDEAMELLMQYSWPGNIRELRHALERGQILCNGQVLRARDLPDEIRQLSVADSQRLNEFPQQLRLPPEGINLPAFIQEIERRLIAQALKECHGNQVRAAARLGLSRDQLRYRLSMY